MTTPSGYAWGWDNTGPAWGARVYPPTSGQDHLGLGSVSSDRILPALSPGINVLTVHPRYWSFYLFVLDEFWSRDLPRTRSAFRDFYRPREAVFAMACHVCDAPEHATLGGNINGSRRVSPLSQQSHFDPRFDYIKEQLGGYGLYYRSTMETTGTIVTATPASGFLFDAPTDTGRAIADAYRKAISPTVMWRDHLSMALDAPVSRDVLVEFARRGCLCQLAKAEKFDLPLLQDLFTHSGPDTESTARRQTFRLLLDVSGICQQIGITEDIFRQLIYFRTIADETYRPVPDLSKVARRWRLYQAREYFAFAFNRLFGWVVRRGLHETDDGLTAIPLTRIRHWVEEALDNHQLAEIHLESATLASQFADQLADNVDLAPGVDEPWSRHDTLDEHALYHRCRNVADDAETLVAMLALVLLINRRVGTAGRIADLIDDAALIAEGGNLRIGMTRFFAELNRRLMAGTTVSELARWIIHDYVIVQHERVATAKLPDDTFRLRRIGDSIRFFPQEAPAGLNDSRFHALSAVVHELDFVSSLRQPQRRLTATGRQLLDQGDLPTGKLAEAASRFTPSTQG